MAEFTITKETRKIFYRASRMAIYSLLAVLTVFGIFGFVTPFKFWENNLSLFLTLGGWVISYHVLEAVRKR